MLRVGVIGTGLIATLKHLPAWKRIEGPVFPGMIYGAEDEHLIVGGGKWKYLWIAP